MSHLPSPPAWLLLTLGLSACGLFGKKDDTSTGDSGDTGDGWVSPCGPWTSAAHVGAEWEWALQEGYSTDNEAWGGWKTVVQGEETYGKWDVFIVQETSSLKTSIYSDWGTQIEWRYDCRPDGLYLVEEEGLWSKTTQLGTDSSWWSIDFDEPPLVLPADLKVGATWTIDTDYTYHAPQTTGATMHLDSSFEVTGEGTAEVPAGSFDGLLVHMVSNGDPRSEFSAEDTVRLVAKQVGDVQIQGYADLQTWDPDPTFSVQP